MNEIIDMSGLDRKDYWVIEFSGVEWEYMIDKLRRDLKLSDLPPKELAFIIAYNMTTHVPAAWLRRKHVPASYLVKMTGQSLEFLENEPTIQLTVKPRPELPAPTVAYWGEA